MVRMVLGRKKIIYEINKKRVRRGEKEWRKDMREMRKKQE